MTATDDDDDDDGEQCRAIVEDKGYPTNPHPCSRKASDGSRYCAQHRRMYEHAPPTTKESEMAEKMSLQDAMYVVAEKCANDERSWAGWRQVHAHITQPAQAVDVVAGSAHKEECPVKMARAICEAIIKHQFQDEHRRGRLTLDVETFLREFNAARYSGATRALGNAQAEAPIARPLSEYHEDHGFVVWFTWDAERGDWLGEPSYIGSPTCDDWPGYHTHYLPHPPFPTPPRPSPRNDDEQTSDRKGFPQA